jgi:hypothetical protein
MSKQNSSSLKTMSSTQHSSKKSKLTGISSLQNNQEISDVLPKINNYITASKRIKPIIDDVPNMTKSVPSKKCTTLFENATYDKSKITKLLNACNEYTKTGNLQQMNKLRNIIRSSHQWNTKYKNLNWDKCDTYKDAMGLYSNMYMMIPEEYYNTPLKYLFNSEYWLQIFEQHIDHLIIKYANSPCVGVANTRVFLSRCLQDVITHNLFVKKDHSSDKYVINQKPDILTQLKNTYGYNIENIDDLKKLYVCVGKLFAYCVCFDIPIPCTIASTMLYILINANNDYSIETIVMYYLIDMDEESRNEIKHLLQYPNEIESKRYKYTIGDTTTRFVTKETFLLFICQQALQYYLQLKKNAKAQLDGFTEGFFIMASLEGVNIGTVTHLMFGYSIRETHIRRFAKMIIYDYDSTNKMEVNIVGWFKQIISDIPLGKLMPDRYILYIKKKLKIDDKTPEEQIRKKCLIDFFTRLLKFWTSMERFNFNTRYIVSFNPLEINKRKNPLTCSNTLYLSRKKTSLDDLYKTLVTTLYPPTQPKQSRTRR